VLTHDECLERENVESSGYPESASCLKPTTVMSDGQNTTQRRKPPTAVLAEAAAWVARLHGPDRTAAVEEACRRWMAEDPVRAEAFELLTDTWDKAGQLALPPMGDKVPRAD